MCHSQVIVGLWTHGEAGMRRTSHRARHTGGLVPGGVRKACSISRIGAPSHLQNELRLLGNRAFQHRAGLGPSRVTGNMRYISVHYWVVMFATSHACHTLRMKPFPQFNYKAHFSVAGCLQKLPQEYNSNVYGTCSFRVG